MSGELNAHLARKVCSTSGVSHKAQQKKLATLKDLKDILEETIKEAGRAADSATYWGWMIVGARVVQISCDWMVMALAKKTGPAGMGVSYLYDVSKLIVDGVNNDLTVGKAVKFSSDVKLDAAAHHLLSTGKGAQEKMLGKLRNTYKASEDAMNIWKDIDNAMGASAGIESAKSTAMKQLKELRRQIRELERDLHRCEVGPSPLLA